MNRHQFEKLVQEALDDLPPCFQEKLENVAVVVEELASSAELSPQGLTNPFHLLGLYHGIPHSHRGVGYTFVLPDRITIYQKAIEAIASTPPDIRRLVRQVVEHEIGHHFGLSDEEIERATLGDQD